MVITQVLKDQDEMKKELAQYRTFFKEMRKKEVCIKFYYITHTYTYIHTYKYIYIYGIFLTKL